MDRVFSSGQAGDGGPGSGSMRAAVARCRDRMVDALHRHNPFYLLSAACMLGGCLLLTNSLSWSPIAFSRLMTLLATIQVYELLLLAIALYLVVHRRRSGQLSSVTNADIAQLLVLWAVFMADAAFLVSEVVSSSIGVGIVVSLAVFAGFIAKAVCITRVLRIRLKPETWAAAVLTVGTLLATPCILKALGDTRVNAFHLYVAWWAVAAVWVVWDVVLVKGRSPSTGDCPVPPQLLMVVIPWLSLVTHLGILHYVYDTPFRAPHATPMLLVTAMVLARLPAPTSQVARGRAMLRIGLLTMAVLVSLGPVRGLGVVVGSSELAPWMFALSGAYLTAVWTFLPQYLLVATAGGVLASLGYLFGPTAAQLAMLARWFADGVSLAGDGLASAARWVWSLAPKSPFQWGVLAVCSSFVLLGIGARISLKRQLPPAETPTGG